MFLQGNFKQSIVCTGKAFSERFKGFNIPVLVGFFFPIENSKFISDSFPCKWYETYNMLEWQSGKKT